MAKKFGFDSRNYKKRDGKSASKRTIAIPQLKLTNAFKEATGAAASAAWNENLLIPCVVDGRMCEVGPDDKFLKINSKL
jgi:hypothetical protein